MGTEFSIKQKLVIVFIFLVGADCFMLGFSSLSQVGMCETGSDSFNSNISPLCTPNEYILQSYFAKHQHLLDSDFQDFIAKNLPSCTCESLQNNLNNAAKLSILHRNLAGEGSHRHISSAISLHTHPESLSQLPTHFCEVIIIERLPSGVFADPFELQHLHQRGVFTEVAVFGDANLELPSFLSNRSAVEIHMDVGLNIFSKQENEWEINIGLPVHARYTPLQDSGYARVEFRDPDLFLHCKLEGSPHNESCLIMSRNSNAEIPIGAAVWKIPSGIRAHANAVSFITFFSSFLSTLLIVISSIWNSNFRPCKNLKQS